MKPVIITADQAADWLGDPREAVIYRFGGHEALTIQGVFDCRYSASARMYLVLSTRWDDDAFVRKFACRCLRDTPLPDGNVFWHILPDCAKEAICVAEDYAAGKATAEHLSNAQGTVVAAWHEYDGYVGSALYAVEIATSSDAAVVAGTYRDIAIAVGGYARKVCQSESDIDAAWDNTYYWQLAELRKMICEDAAKAER